MNQQFHDPPAGPRAHDAWLSGLLAASAGGDAQAFERFYDATVRDALALAGQLLRGPLEDVLTASYLQAWRDCARFEPAHGGALDWLLAIVREQAGRPDPEPSR
jgi:RNA polymerase sigma-70 factor (ECF subfamily)